MLSRIKNIEFCRGEFSLLVALALFGMDFMLQGIIILILYGVVFCVRNESVSTRFNTCIFVFCFAFVLFYMLSARFEMAVFKNIVAIPIAVMIGCKVKCCSPEKIVFYLVFIAFAMAFHAMLNMAYNYSQLGIQAIAERTAYDFWTRDISAATGQASKLTPFIACSFYLIFYSGNKLLRLFSIILLFATIMFDLGLAGRSALVLLFFSIVLSFFIGSFRSKKIRSSARVLILFAFVIIGVLVAYSFNLFGIQEILDGSSFNQRFNSPSGQDINEDDRTRRKLLYLSHLLDYPFGGQHLCFDLNIGHAHDLWLDTFDMVGLVPFIILICYTITSFLRSYRFYKMVDDPYIATLVITFFIIMNIQFYLEPIIEGSPKLFIYYCMVDAMIAQYISRRTKYKL